MRRLTAVLVCSLAAVFGPLHAGAAQAVPKPKDDPPITIAYSGSATQATSLDNPALGSGEIHIAWDLQWSGRLSQLAAPYLAPNKAAHFTVRHLEGTYTFTYPPPNAHYSCTSAFSQGPNQRIGAILDDGELRIQVTAPLSTAFTTAAAQIIAEPVGRSCLDLSIGQPNSRHGAPPPHADSTSPDVPHVTYDLADGSQSWKVDEHPTVHAFGRTDHWDFTSTLTITGRSCAGSGSGKQCDPQVLALEWGREDPVVRDLESGVPGSNGGLLSEDWTSYRPACAAAWRRAQYFACPHQRPGTLTPSKSWPVVAVGGTRPAFRNVLVYIPPAPFPIAGARLEGVATIDGKSVTFTSTSRHLTRVADWWRFDAVAPTNQGFTWPRKVLDLTTSDGRPLRIKWTLVAGRKKKRYPAGTTLLDVFVLRRPPQGQAGRPYLSLIYPAARDGHGATSDAKTIAGVWKAFAQADRHGLRRWELEPSTGQIAPGRPLQFWPAGWNPEAAYARRYADPGCARGVVGLLAVRLATCNGFADYHATMLRLFGVAANRVQPHALNGFIPFGLAPYFLVGSWSFATTAPTDAVYYDAAFPHVFGFHFPPPTGGQPGPPTLGPADEVAYVGATGQWNPTPPAMWSTSALAGIPLAGPGDHDLVEIPGQARPIYDPSYGTGPFADVGDWVNQSIVGWARVVDENGRGIVDDAECGKAYATCYLLVHRGR